jgi:rhodanese-related sulfurtransferase
MTPLTETGWLGPLGALLAAPAIGFAFGWFLERGGLGSAPKLAGQFYLTDLTVFKVMFSALVTAMLGAFWLDRAGVLQLDRVFLPETFVLPQVLGGVLFGAGFLVAGLCPGTSCVAAAAGRRDGVGVIAGMLVGVWVFNLAFEWIAPLYSATPLGAVRLTDLLGTTPGVGVAAVTAMALAGFAVANRIERRVPSAVEGRASSKVRGGALAVVAALAAIGAGAVDRGTITLQFISAPDLAGRIMRGDRDLGLFDLRPPAAFERFHIPTARRATADDLAAMALAPQTNVVLYADARATLFDALHALRGRNHRDVRVLKEGIFEWVARVQEPRLAVDATPAERDAFERAAEMSRFFGGVPRAGVSREEVPQGYWTGTVRSEELLMAAALQSVTAIRRRGC